MTRPTVTIEDRAYDAAVTRALAESATRGGLEARLADVGLSGDETLAALGELQRGGLARRDEQDVWFPTERLARGLRLAVLP